MGADVVYAVAVPGGVGLGPFIAVGVVLMLAGPLYRRLSPDAGSRIGGRAMA